MVYKKKIHRRAIFFSFVQHLKNDQNLVILLTVPDDPNSLITIHQYNPNPKLS